MQCFILQEMRGILHFVRAIHVWSFGKKRQSFENVCKHTHTHTHKAQRFHDSKTDALGETECTQQAGEAATILKDDAFGIYKK